MAAAIHIILLMSLLLKVSQPIRVDFTGPVFYRHVSAAELRSTLLPTEETWPGQRIVGGWTSVSPAAGLLDSAAGGRSSFSWMRVSQLLRMLRSWEVRGPSGDAGDGSGGESAFSRWPDPPTWHRSVPYFVRVPAKDRDGGLLLKLTKTFLSEAVPDNVENINDIGMAADNPADVKKRWKKSALSGLLAKVINSQELDDELRPSPQLSHPIYLGMGRDAVDEAYKTYISIIAPSSSTRNSRKVSINPVNFVGRR